MSEVVHTSLKKAVKGTTLVSAGMVGGTFLWFLIKLVIVRSISVEEFGMYTLVLTVAGILSAMAALGVQEGVARYVSTFLGEGRKEDADSVSRASLHIGIVSGAAAFVSLYVLSEFAARYVFYKPEIAFPLKIISVSIPFLVVSNILANVLRGHGIIRPKVYYMDIGHALYFLLLAGALLVMGFSYISIIYAYTIATVMVFVSISAYGCKKTGLNPVPLKRGRHYGPLLGFSLPLLVAGITALLLNWTDILMLGRYSTPENVGSYNVSVSLARLLLFILTASSFVFLPIAGEMYARGQSAELKRTYQVLTKWIFSATFPIFFLLFFFPEMTITFLFGERLVGASTPLRILTLGFLFHVFLGANEIVLLAMGMTRVIMKISGFAAALNIILNYIFIKRLGYGMTGAAAASLISYISGNILTSSVLYRHSGVHPFTSGHLRPVVGTAVIGLAIYAVAKNLPLYLWMMPLYLVLFVAGYLFSQLATRSLGREDVALFEAISERAGVKMPLISRFLRRFARE